MNKLIVKIAVGSTLMILVAIAVFFWNEARKEVVFLCSNFKKGDTEAIVRRQLDTGNLLTYRSEPTTEGSQITANSGYNLWMYRCVVDFDESGRVVESKVQ